MKQFFRYFFVASCAVLCGIEELSAQWGFDEPEPLIYLDFRAEVGIMVPDNEGTAGFVPARTTAYGFHLEAGHHFGEVSVFSGLGFNLLPFRQRQVQPIGAFVPSERITAHTRYYSLEVPLGLSYNFANALSVHAAFKMHFMALRNTEHSLGNLDFPSGVSLLVNERNEMDDWQFIPEIAFGFDYDIGSRLRIAFFGAFSLATLQGVSWDYTVSEIGEEDLEYNYDMSYSWFRYGAGLTYHIVR